MGPMVVRALKFGIKEFKRIFFLPENRTSLDEQKKVQAEKQSTIRSQQIFHSN